jgi:hypothetical protein
MLRGTGRVYDLQKDCKITGRSHTLCSASSLSGLTPFHHFVRLKGFL